MTESSEFNRTLVATAARTFTNIARAWSLTEQEQLAILGISELSALAVDGTTRDLLPETLERISYVIGIYRALHTIFPNQRQADGWIRRPNKATLFNGPAALARMCTGQVRDLEAVRRHLDAQNFVHP